MFFSSFKTYPKSVALFQLNRWKFIGFASTQQRPQQSELTSFVQRLFRSNHDCYKSFFVNRHFPSSFVRLASNSWRFFQLEIVGWPAAAGKLVLRSKVLLRHGLMSRRTSPDRHFASSSVFLHLSPSSLASTLSLSLNLIFSPFWTPPTHSHTLSQILALFPLHAHTLSLSLSLSEPCAWWAGGVIHFKHRNPFSWPSHPDNCWHNYGPSPPPLCHARTHTHPHAHTYPHTHTHAIARTRTHSLTLFHYVVNVPVLLVSNSLYTSIACRKYVRQG